MSTEGPAGWSTQPGVWNDLKPAARGNRARPTAAEARLWQVLRSRRLGARFRRQHAIGVYIVDFYCSAASLVVEIDGPIHEFSQAEDANRRQQIEEAGFRVARFTNDQVMNSLEAVLSEIAALVANTTSPPAAASPSPPRRGGSLESRQLTK